MSEETKGAPAAAPSPLPFPETVMIGLEVTRTKLEIADPKDEGEPINAPDMHPMTQVTYRLAIPVDRLGLGAELEEQIEREEDGTEVIVFHSTVRVPHAAVTRGPNDTDESFKRALGEIVAGMLQNDFYELLNGGAWLGHAMQTIRPSPYAPPEGVAPEQLAAVIMWLTPDERHRFLSALLELGATRRVESKGDGKVLSDVVKALALLGVRHATAETIPPPPETKEAARESEAHAGETTYLGVDFGALRPPGLATRLKRVGQLTTRIDGQHRHVAHLELPDFDSPPKVITWGGRTFVFDEEQLDAGWRYVEAFAYAASP